MEFFNSDADSCNFLFLTFAQRMISFKDSKNKISLKMVLIKAQWLLQAKTDGQDIPMSCLHVPHTAERY